MGNIDKIILYNRLLNKAISNKDYEDADKYCKELHKLERRDHVELGAYRIRSIND